MRRIFWCVGAAALTSIFAACFQVGTYAVQHSIGPCQASKDSVQAVLGKPYWRSYSDEEGNERAQIFWHEWGYAIPRDSTIARALPAGATPLRDSVRVVGFLWGQGVEGCSVRERRVLKATHPAVPWQNAGEVPRDP